MDPCALNNVRRKPHDISDRPILDNVRAAISVAVESTMPSTVVSKQDVGYMSFFVFVPSPMVRIDDSRSERAFDSRVDSFAGAAVAVAVDMVAMVMIDIRFFFALYGTERDTKCFVSAANCGKAYSRQKTTDRKQRVVPHYES